jgi:hypothetical protein
VLTGGTQRAGGAGQGGEIGEVIGEGEILEHLGAQARETSVEGGFNLGERGMGVILPPGGHLRQHRRTQRPPSREGKIHEVASSTKDGPSLHRRRPLVKIAKL